MSQLILPSPRGHWIEDDLFRLDYPYEIYVDGVGWVYICSGFVYDGQSIPRFWWRLAGHPFAGRSQPAALIHDGLKRSKLVSDYAADRAFLWLLLRNHAEKPRIKYAVVRAVSIAGFPRYTQDQIDYARRHVSVEFC